MCVLAEVRISLTKVQSPAAKLPEEDSLGSARVHIKPTECCQQGSEEDVGKAIQEIAKRLLEIGRELQGVTAQKLPRAKKIQLLELGAEVLEVAEPGVAQELLQAMLQRRFTLKSHWYK